MIPTLLDRYYFRRGLLLLISIMITLWGLYALIDYTSRSAHFSLPPLQLATYYLLMAVKRLDLLLPFALTIMTLRIALESNVRLEIVAAMASGVSKRRLFAPLLLIGLLACAVITVSYEWWLPSAYRTIESLEGSITAKNSTSTDDPSVHRIQLADGSLLLFAGSDRDAGTLTDLYWIRSLDQILHFDRFYPTETPPMAEGITVLERTSSGALIPLSTRRNDSVDALVIPKSLLEREIVPVSEYSLSELYTASSNHPQKTHRDHEIAAAWVKRLTTPLLCLIAVLLPLPLCTHFSRRVHGVMIWLFALLGLVVLYLLIGAGYTLASHGVVPAEWAIALPLLLLTCLGAFRFLRMV